METKFENITNRLDINPATRDTTYDKTLQKGRTIKKIPYQFVIPRTQIDLVAVGVAAGGALIHQFNLTAPINFRLLNNTVAILNQDILTYAFICIRYRIGATVVRYRLKLSGDSSFEALLDNFSGVQAPAYNGQQIKTNFAIELWTLNGAQTNIDVGPFTVTTGLLRVPYYPGEEEAEIAIADELDRAELDQPMPEVLPTTYGDASCWLTN
jgi:hypothetical protein